MDVSMHVGHLYGFGNTEEAYRVKVLGCKGRGRARHGHFNHWNGRGYVVAQDGQYRDALVRKRSRVIPMIVETLGPIAPHSLSYVSHLARRATGKGARDSTKYGTSRTSTRSFFVHHAQRISVAACIGSVKALRKTLINNKLHTATGRPASDSP